MIREQFGQLYFLREFNKRGQFSFARTTKRFPSSLRLWLALFAQ